MAAINVGSEFMSQIFVVVLPAVVVGGVVFVAMKLADRRRGYVDTRRAGWHQDPDGDQGQLRYWDGERWTERRGSSP